MVRIYRSEHNYPEPPKVPIFAYFIRYPNPFARHVLTVDVLDRHVHPETGQLITRRLLLKRGIIPKWGSKWLPSASMSGGRGLDAWILEESVVDPPEWGGDNYEDESNQAGPSTQLPPLNLPKRATQPEDEMYGQEPRLKFRQANLNHRKFMHVVESGELCAGADGSTSHRTVAEIKSDFGGAWSNMIRQRIESYGVGKFEVNSDSARKGMSLVMHLLRSRQPLPDSGDIYPPPPPQFGDSWTKSQSASSTATPSTEPPHSSHRSPADLEQSQGTVANEGIWSRWTKGWSDPAER